MIKIEELKNYTIPYCGNKRIQPYGDLVISDGESRKTCKIQDDGAKQYFTFNRKRYYVRNAGTLYSPKFVIVGSIEDAVVWTVTEKSTGFRVCQGSKRMEALEEAKKNLDMIYEKMQQAEKYKGIIARAYAEG